MDVSLQTFVLQMFGILVVVIAAMLAGGMLQALGYRFRVPRTTLKREEDIHPVLAPFFRAGEEFLFSEGFRPSHCQATQLMEVTTYPEQWEKVYLNPEDKIFATLTTAHVPDVAMPAYISFMSVLSDGSRLLTTNGRKHMIICDIPQTEVLDPYNENPRHVLQAHRQRLDEMRGTRNAVTLTPDGYIEDLSKTMEAYFGSLVSTGLMARADNGLFRLTFRGAVRFVLRAMRGNKLMAQLLSRARKRLKETPPSGPDSVPPLPVAVEVQAFLRHRSLNQRLNVPAKSKAVLFLATLVLFAAIGAALFDPFYTAALLIALMVHELGHALGMQMFGYRNINVILLPMLGAVTTGHPDGNKKPWQEAVILLMGPVPGLFIGTALILSDSFAGNALASSGALPGQGMLIKTGTLFLIINALNLLPVMPLDGGRLVNLLLLSRSPRLQSAFLVLSMLAAGAGAVLLKEPVLGFLAFALFFMSGKSFQHIRAVKALRANADPGVPGGRNENKDLASIFRLMREKPFRDLPFVQKIKTAQVLYEAAFGMQPSLSTSILFLGFYASLIVIIPTLVLGGFFVLGLLNPVSIPDPVPTREYLTEADFPDRLTLTYSEVSYEDTKDGTKIQTNTHTVKKAESGNHTYDFIQEYTSALSVEAGKKYHDTILLDRYGRIVFPEGEGPDPGEVQYLSYWIPSEEILTGEYLFGYFTAETPFKLLGRDVLPLKAQATERYYDMETGFHLLTQLQHDKALGCDILSWLSGSSDERVGGFASEMDRSITERLEKDTTVCIADLVAE